MILSTIKRAAAASMPLMLGAAPPPPAAVPSQYTQIIVREQIVVRVPPRLRQSDGIGFRWKEHKGPKCIPARAIAAAAVMGQDSVDLLLRDNRRLRMKLDSKCPALDYYYGFYISPDPDGMICADRDLIRSRVGGECGIDRFRLLSLKRTD
jgi:hypothetical protein